MTREGSDTTLRLLLRLLANRGIAVRLYLAQTPIIEQSMRMLLAHLAMASAVRWQDTAPILRPLARQGWHLGRWLPTFLLIDGPFGRLFRGVDSPVSQALRSDRAAFPLLTAARDAFNHDLFRRLRNGFGHWSFICDDSGTEAQIRIIHWETGRDELRIGLLEAEALHFFTYCIIEAVDEAMFSALGTNSGGG